MPISPATTTRTRAELRGFSLIELTAVLAILAVVAGGVAVRSHVAARQARMADLLDGIAEYDRRTRRHARTHDRPARLVIELGGRPIRRTTAEGAAEGAPLELPDGWAVEEVRLADRRVRTGSVALGCSRSGLTPSYGLLLAHRHGQRRWLLVAGLTGQVSEIGRAHV